MRPIIVLGFFAVTGCVGPTSETGSPVFTTSAGVTVESTPPQGPSFGQFRTFAFTATEGPPTGFYSDAQQAEVIRRMVPMLTEGLVAKGYTPTTGKPDLLISLGTGRRSVAVHDVSSVEGGWLPNDENAELVERAFVVDAYNGNTMERVWRGESTDTLESGVLPDQRLRYAIDGLLEAFPKVTAKAESASP